MNYKSIILSREAKLKIIPQNKQKNPPNNNMEYDYIYVRL